VDERVPGADDGERLLYVLPLLENMVEICLFLNL
jgi:hypothetical protein